SFRPGAAGQPRPGPAPGRGHRRGPRPGRAGGRPRPRRPHQRCHPHPRRRREGGLPAAALDAGGAVRTTIPARPGADGRAQAYLLREVVGNPSRPPPLDPAWLAWNGATVKRLAQEAYTERLLPSGHLDPARLAVLADALEDAGCDDAVLLEHLRGPGPH